MFRSGPNGGAAIVVLLPCRKKALASWGLKVAKVASAEGVCPTNRGLSVQALALVSVSSHGTVHCVLGQDTLLALPTNGGWRDWWH